MVLLAGLFVLALAATVYFRRRMAQDLVRPVASLRQGVLKLQAGEFTNRITVSRRDELGELAEAFNGMASALHESHLALTSRATHDSLTGLANRASLTERLAGSFSPAGDRRARQESVLFIDVDDFKDVNDSLGHDGGDALLVQLAARLTDCVRGRGPGRPPRRVTSSRSSSSRTRARRPPLRWRSGSSRPSAHRSSSTGHRSRSP